MSMRHYIQKPGARDSGFTLLEVLIALLVLSIGLLGLAALQTVGLRSNQMATMRTTAVQAAYDITDRMRANPEGLTEANKFYVLATGAKPSSAKDCDDEVCTSQELATFDLVQWRAQLTTLPDGTGSITQAVDGITGQVTHSITVFWNEERDPAAVGTGCDPNDKTDLRCIQLTM